MKNGSATSLREHLEMFHFVEGQCCKLGVLYYCKAPLVSGRKLLQHHLVRGRVLGCLILLQSSALLDGPFPKILLHKY